VTLRTEIGQWILLMIQIVEFFFSQFDMELFTENRMETDLPIIFTMKLEMDVVNVIKRLYYAIRILLDYHPRTIGREITEVSYSALNILSSHTDFLHFDIDPTQDINLNGTLKRKKLRKSLCFGDIQQALYRNKFYEFVEYIKAADSHDTSDLAVFEKIPFQEANLDDVDVRFQPLLRKITLHVRASLKRSGTHKSLHKKAQDTTVWLLQSFRHMLEKIMQIDLENVTKTDFRFISKSHSSKLNHLTSVFDENGITYLCLDLISIGIPLNLCVEAMRLLVALMLRDGGNAGVQHNIHTYLFEMESTFFFEQLKEMIESISIWATKECEVDTIQQANASKIVKKMSQGEADDEVDFKVADFPPEYIVFKLLQLMCEGNNLTLKNLIREQDENARVVGVIECLCSLMDLLSRFQCRLATRLLIIVIKTVRKLMQGPCEGNQELIVIRTELLVSLNRIMRIMRPTVMMFHNAWLDDIEDLKIEIVDILRATIEGQLFNSVVFERVISTIEIGVLTSALLPSSDDDVASMHLDADFEMPHVQGKYLVFLRNLEENRGKLSKFAEEMIETEIQSVEVVWKEAVHTVYFKIPHIHHDLPVGRKASILDEVDVSSQELKLSDFVRNVKLLYREALHQRLLRSVGLVNIWTLRTWLSWAMFANAFVMNVILLAYYGTLVDGAAKFAGVTLGGDDGTIGLYASYESSSTLHHRSLSFMATDEFSQKSQTNPMDTVFIPSGPAKSLFFLNILQIILSFANLFMYIIVRFPMTFVAHTESGTHWVLSAIYAAGDLLNIWYLGYLVFCIIALVYNPLFLSALLLDFVVLDSTTRDVLVAVWAPARQLVATLIIILIVINIFSGLIFYIYRHDIIGFNVFDMWETFKVVLSYGIRGEYGIGHEMSLSVGNRMILDVVFYFVVLAILRHIFFAIIVDTFGKLRELKFERDMQMNNSCFICGVERHDFDKGSVPGKSSGFAFHRQVTHFTGNYILFIMHIWEQATTDDDGIELHVRKCLEKGDISWFPVGTSGVRDRHGGHHDSGAGSDAMKITSGPNGSSNSSRNGSSTSTSGDGGGGGGGGGSSGRVVFFFYLTVTENCTL